MTAKQYSVSSAAELREIIGEPIDLAVAKAIGHLDKYCREMITRSPFLCLATADAAGRTDVSPRGDQPGFVEVLDDNTLFIPERPGNRRVDSLTNIIENPNVGLLFMIPGFDDTLRVNGPARLVADPALLARSAVKGKEPKIGIEVTVVEAYLHCAKAFKRSRLWDPARHQDRSELPSLGRMIMEQTAAAGTPPAEEVLAEVDALVEENYRTELY